MSFELIYAALTFGTVFLFGMFILWEVFGRGIRKEFPAPSVGESLDGFYHLHTVNRRRAARGLPALSSRDARIAEAARPIHDCGPSLTDYLIAYEIGSEFYPHNQASNPGFDSGGGTSGGAGASAMWADQIPTIAEKLSAIGESVPKESWDRVPTDLSMGGNSSSSIDSSPSVDTSSSNASTDSSSSSDSGGSSGGSDSSGSW